MKSQASYPVIPVNQLKPGMYVIAIASQTGGIEIAQMGLVTSVAQIANLVRQGVLTVRIDLARSKLGSTESDAVISPDLNANSAQAGRRASANGEGRELKIRRLYQEARELQGKFIRQLKAGEPIDITPLAEVAEEMVDTMFSHGDAMLCLARIRAKDAYLMEHSMNVAILLANFGRYLGLERSVLKELTLGGLLHDVGKIAAEQSGRGIHLWLRGPLVLAEAMAPRMMDGYADDSPTSGWRYLLHVHLEHPAIGAQMAAQAGCDELTCWLIAQHQETPESIGQTGSLFAQDEQAIRLLSALRRADQRN